MTLIPIVDQDIIGLCLHGQSEALDKSIFKPDWLQSDISRKLAEASISLTRDGQPVNPVSVVSRAKLSVPGLLTELIRLRKNGFGQAVMGDAVNHSYQVFAVNKAVGIADEMKRLAQNEPQNFEKWLARQATSIVGLIHDGDAYDPRPSAHLQKPLPTVFASSLITGMNDMLRGGYKKPYFGVYAGVTSHGKSVTLDTHAIDLLLQQFHVAFIITENTEQKVTAKIAASMAGVDYDTEVAPGKFKGTEFESPEEREARYKERGDYIEQYLTVYRSDYCNDSKLKRIAKWEKPDAIIIDYLKKQPGLFSRSGGGQDEVGDFADWLLDFANTEGICVITAGQMSKDAAKRFLKSGSTEDIILYGTARVEYASDQFIPLRRHPSLKNTAEFRVKKDRDGGKLDTKHVIPMDFMRKILEIKRLSVLDGIKEDF
jgi:hypothetical protein